MTKAIVDRFEVVEIENQNNDRLAFANLVRKKLLDTVKKNPTIQKSYSGGSRLASGIGNRKTSPCMIGTKIAGQRLIRALRRSRQSSNAVRKV